MEQNCPDNKWQLRKRPMMESFFLVFNCIHGQTTQFFSKKDSFFLLIVK